ncbi:MAG: hypothetical protein AVDCRST_MAG73-3791 [uncultured Thermomicrobiales bacterium]|uniref:N-acetyltransferase domain-containing protein n=1 Tax=uncultured Thermomicrobiales bacterium TaxID=1645740 RepID=A0A6J4UYM3_9BACT|nr:MAG: hypothetical protein AVDCRST_MAG73-3791 [uncultured Thermomicrobiales bacterium]
MRGDRGGFWAAVAKETGGFLGWFHLRPEGGGDPDIPELGYRLRRTVRNQGPATEGSRALIAKAFADLGPRQVVAVTYGEHGASRRAMAKSGLALVRTYRLMPERLASSGPDAAKRFPGDDVEDAITTDGWERQGRRTVAGGVPAPARARC